jgi:uncharacterized protein (TIGR02145 family)
MINFGLFKKWGLNHLILEKPEAEMMYARIIMMVFFPIFTIAQAPQKINFQSILRNSSGEVIGNKSVSLKITILSESINGSSVYSETHAKTTDASGLISLQIGMGTLVSGVFNSINWGNLAHFIKLEADFSGGSNYVVLGTQELMSVPYAMYASKTDTSVLNLTSRLATKLNVTDTASLSNRIDLKLTKTDTASLSNRIDAKLTKTDTASLSNRIDDKLTKTDTASLSNRIDDKLTKTDTASLSNRIDAKLTKTDTADMLSTYLRKTDAIITDLQNQVALLTSYTSLLVIGVVDIDGNIYPVVKIGNQIWMKENLRVSRYRNGGLIPNVTNNTAWSNSTIGARSYYDNDEANNVIYGTLYNWYTTRGDTLCPTGWGVPTDAEWTTLAEYLEGEEVAGGKMKTIGTTYWNSPNTGANNSSGFSVLPGGYRNNVGSFGGISYTAFFWSASEDDNDAWGRILGSDNSNVYRVTSSKSVGASVRCLRD